MRVKKHLLILVVCAIALSDARNIIRNFPLLQFREIGDVKLIYKYENVDVRNYKLQPVLDNLLEEMIKTSFENNEFIPERDLLIENLRKLNFTYSNFLNSPQQRSNRKKRSWDAFGNALKWAGGVMNAEDRYEMRQYLRQIYENQTNINNKMESIMTQLNKLSKLKAENRNESLTELYIDLKQLKESSLMQEFKERYAMFSTKINAIMSSYVSGRLDSQLIDDNIVQKFIGDLNRSSQFACGTPLNCIKNSETKFEFHDGHIKISLKVPVTELRAFKLYEVSSIPATYSDNIIFFKAQHKYYAYNNDSEELFAFINDYKRSCFSDSTTHYFCSTEDIISNTNTHDCLLTAIRDKIIDTELCSENMELHQLEDFAVIKFDNRRFWIHSELPNFVRLSCIDSEDIKNVTNNLIIDLPFECRGSINGLKLVTYALNEDQYFTTTFSANISKESFRDVINTMAAVSTLSSDLIYDLDAMKMMGLKEKAFSAEESMQAKNQWQENEIEVLHAEHNKFIIIVLVLAVGALLFILARRHKSIFILTNQKENENEPPKYCDEKDESDASLNIKSNFK